MIVPNRCVRCGNSVDENQRKYIIIQKDKSEVMLCPECFVDWQNLMSVQLWERIGFIAGALS